MKYTKRFRQFKWRNLIENKAGWTIMECVCSLALLSLIGVMVIQFAGSTSSGQVAVREFTQEVHGLIDDAETQNGTSTGMSILVYLGDEEFSVNMEVMEFESLSGQKLYAVNTPEMMYPPALGAK